MSTTALIIVLLGLSIMVSRAPLLVAPEQTRSTYLRLFDTAGKMRVMGLVMGAIAGLILWLVWGLADTPSVAVQFLAGLILVLAVIAMIPFPDFSSGLATRVWSAFSPGVLRVLGALAIVVGGLIVWYGFSL